MEKDREVAFQKVIRATGEVHMQLHMLCIFITTNILKHPYYLAIECYSKLNFINPY